MPQGRAPLEPPGAPATPPPVTRPPVSRPVSEDRSLAGLRRDWEDLAGVDPFWAILTDDARRGGRWDLADFLATGEAEIADLVARAAALGRPSARRASLDFGCGVGRLTRALASRFEEAVGVDISARMLEHARRINGDVANVRFVRNSRPDLAAFPDGSFDLVYSNLVLQHLPTRALAERYIREFVRVLAAGGILVFQVPERIPLRHRLQPRRRLYGVLRAAGLRSDSLYRRLGLHPIRMIDLSARRVERIIAGAGGRILEVQVALDEPSGIENRTYWVSRSGRDGSAGTAGGG